MGGTLLLFRNEVRKCFCVKAHAWIGFNRILLVSTQGLIGSIEPDTIVWFNSGSNWPELNQVSARLNRRVLGPCLAWAPNDFTDASDVCGNAKTNRKGYV